MVESAFARMASAFTLSLCFVSLAILSYVSAYLWLAPVLAAWTASPILWWWGWSLRRVPRRVSRRTAWVLGTAVAAAFLGAHVLSWYAVHASSTGGMAYLTLPFVLLLLTIAATSICDAASKHEATEDWRAGRTEVDEVSAMARDLARRDSRRAARARR